MNCPICNEQLTMAERQGVEIDYCPKCRGVWLDRGELDKIIERSVGAPSPDAEFPLGLDRGRREGSGEHKPYKKHDKHQKRESWLSDLFDF